MESSAYPCNNIVGAAINVNEKSYFYGYSNKILSKKVTSNTVFGIGSITKTFVSVVLLKLEADKKLNINDKITKFFPKYTRLNNVTIKELMQMDAGFNDAKTSKRSLSPTQQIMVAYKKYNSKLLGHWQYSNVSYQLLGKLIEKITHTSLENAIAKLVILPLNLKHTCFPNKAEKINLLGYQNGKANLTDYQNAFAAGGLVSNAHDLNIFVSHLFVTKNILHKRQYDELTTFINTPKKYYAFTGIKSPKFGLGVFKWDIPLFGQILTYPGVLGVCRT